ASQVVPNLLARFGDYALLADERQHVVQLYVRLHVLFFKTVMDSLIGLAREGRIAIRIVARPAVVMDRGVMRVGHVADVMPQDARVVDDSLFNPFAFV